MAPSNRKITEAELGVLQALWELGDVSVRQLVDRLYPEGGPSAPPTVQKLLERLEAKGFVNRDRSGTVQTFHATIGHGSLVNLQLQTVAEELCGGSVSSLLTHFVENEGLDAGQRQALRKLIDEWESPEQEENR